MKTHTNTPITITLKECNLIVTYLSLLRQMYEDGVVPSMIDDSDHDERIDELNEVLKPLIAILPANADE